MRKPKKKTVVIGIVLFLIVGTWLTQYCWSGLIPGIDAEILIRVKDVKGNTRPLVGYKLFRNGRLCESKDQQPAISNERGELNIVVPPQGTGGTRYIWEDLFEVSPEDFPVTFEIRYENKVLFKIYPTLGVNEKVKINCVF